MEGKVEREGRRGRIEGRSKVIWDEEGRKLFKEKMTLEVEGEGTEEAWEDKERRIKKAMRSTEEVQKKGKIVRRR